MIKIYYVAQIVGILSVFNLFQPSFAIASENLGEQSLEPGIATPINLSEFDEGVNGDVSQTASDLMPLETQVSENTNVYLNSSLPTNPWVAQSSIEEQLADKREPAKNYPYISLGLGIGIPNNINASQDEFFPNVFGQGVGANVETSLDQSLDLGFAGEIAGGYQFDSARVELAIGYGNFSAGNGNVGVTVNNFPRQEYFSVDTYGDAHYVSVLVSGYYDIPTGSKFRPYVGVGIGYVNLGTGDISFDSPLGATTIAGGNVGAFGYQGKLGLSYEVIPKGTFFGEFGYIGTTGFSVNNVDYDPFGAIRVAVGWRQGF